MTAMAEYIACRSCISPDCKGCNLKRLETMLENGKFECLMNENRGINISADVDPVKHGRWVVDGVYVVCSVCNRLTLSPIVKQLPIFKFCPNCGAKMDGGADNG